MLDEGQIKVLKQHNICDETIAQIEDYDESKELVTFKDGTQKQLVECFARVMGYYRPFSQFNTGKQSEFKERKWFDENKVPAAPEASCVVSEQGGCCG